MKWSQLHIPTLRESPAEAEVASHRLLLRAGYVRQLSAGIYSYLFLGQRSLLKIQQIIREEMNAIGGQEMYLPAIHPAEVWKESGRWDIMGDNLFRLKDRWGRDLCLGMTHEEVMTTIARGEIRSYKQLPQIWYQIQTKFRDEPRPKSGLLRTRQFTMKDSYSFDLLPTGLDVSYEKHRVAYMKIFDRCGLRYQTVEADSGAMGGSQSHEFMVESDAGEDYVAICEEAGYAANIEKAVARPSTPSVPDDAADRQPEKFATPGQKTIDDLAKFTGLPSTHLMKSVVQVADGKPYLCVLRGDHQLSETKFASFAQAVEIRPAHPAEIQDWFGAAPGSLGPVGVKNVRVVIDRALEGRTNLITGANEDDYHLRFVTPGKAFQGEWADLRQVAQGDTHLETGAPLKIVKTVEVGHIFKLGYKYSDSMGLKVLDEAGKEVTVIMGSYGIGVERILCAAIELFHDENGLALPQSIAPFDVVVTPVNNADEAQCTAANSLFAECRRLGLDALLDDRNERPGVKFKDADLIGVPYRITIGKKLPQGIVEVVSRRARQAAEMPLAEAAQWIATQIGR